MEISSLSPPGCGPVFKYLVEKHKELETVSIGLYGERSTEDEMDILVTKFSIINLRSISLHCMESKGDIFSCLPSTLPNLEKLFLVNWRSVTNQGIIEILNRSKSNLRELDLSRSKITGVGIEEGVNSLLNLETLKLSLCYNLTDGGLKEILRISGSSIRVLDISSTNITGQGFMDGVSLPMLEELNLSSCRELTDGGLKEILRISGSSIRVLDVSYTNITEQGFKDGVSLYAGATEPV